MVKDTEMTDADKSKPKEEEKKEVKEESKPPIPPLISSARRLERLLGGGVSNNGKEKENGGMTGNNGSYTYTNPAKVVRRWLGTSSGAAGEAKADDVKTAAAELLDPKGPCAQGRSLLLSEEPSISDTEPTYLDMAAAREVESWLISLAVRILYKDGNHKEAFDLAQHGINIIMGHLDASSSALFPLLSRMFRLRALTAESLDDPVVLSNLRVDMAQAHNMASLRRDVDTQATVLNCMLRDLLRQTQGMWLRVLCNFCVVSYSAL